MSAEVLRSLAHSRFHNFSHIKVFYKTEQDGWREVKDNPRVGERFDIQRYSITMRSIIFRVTSLLMRSRRKSSTQIFRIVEVMCDLHRNMTSEHRTLLEPR